MMGSTTMVVIYG